MANGEAGYVDKGRVQLYERIETNELKLREIVIVVPTMELPLFFVILTFLA